MTMLAPVPSTGIRDLHSTETERLRQIFHSTGDGLAAVRQRTELIDRIVGQLCDVHLPAAQEQVSVIATGGYGRRELFPHSDLDLLFVCEREPNDALKTSIKRICRDLWDLQLRVSPVTRTLEQCDRFEHDNVEFAVSLLDSRRVVGGTVLAEALRQVLPRLCRREWQPIVDNIAKTNLSRHSKHGSTVFHLEPNVKDGPGGLRDYHVLRWLSLLAALDKYKRWPEDHELLAELDRDELARAWLFLVAVRCFLHYRSGRDENQLDWHAQHDASAASIGMAENGAFSATEWMRTHFRHSRTIHRNASYLLEHVPSSRSTLYQSFQRWRSRLSNSEFLVVQGRVFLQQSTDAYDPEVVLRLFIFMAHHGLALSRDTEQRIVQALPALTPALRSGANVWPLLSNLLHEPHAASSLRVMQTLGVLTAVLPEFQLVDSLVVRDYYHRYTVDEHTLLAIDNIHRLNAPQGEWERRFSEIKAGAPAVELLCLALLLHDIGKGVPGAEHVSAGNEIASGVLLRFGLATEERELVQFLVGNHLEVSGLLRHDIFAAETIRALAHLAGTPEQLKLLTLMTYADIKAVNPEALTTWKAENLWRLYIAAFNYLNRSVDLDDEETADDAERIAHISAMVGVPQQVQKFVHGLPRRYLRTHSVDQVRRDLALVAAMREFPVQIALEHRGSDYEVTVVTRDRHALFAIIAGALYAWGMNILKAEAFSSSAGIVVDRFLCKDRFRSLELNSSEQQRLQRLLSDGVQGEINLSALMQDRAKSDRSTRKVKVETRVKADNKISPHSTLVEIVAQDRPGLLHLIAAVIADSGCDIQTALINTEGQTAADVFYVTDNRKKLGVGRISELTDALISVLERQAQA